MSRPLLIVAYHFPPLQGSTGIHRTLAFSRYLTALGWDITVLTAAPKAYPEIRLENEALIPPNVRVERAFALDTQRHLSIRGRYLKLMATPDRWQSWIAGGFVKGMAIIRKQRPAAILSTYPIASAHCIGYRLHRYSGIPWIADFRDPMAQENYPTDATIRKAFERIEKNVFDYAARVTTTTAGTLELYANKFPHYNRSRIRVVPNGFDEEIFAGLPTTRAIDKSAVNRPLLLLHSGLLYPHERNPQALFQAIAELRKDNVLTPSDVRFVFQGSGHEEQYAPQIERYGIADLVTLAPAVPYKIALQEMVNADACLILQSASCNQQIPAKIYEYLYVGRPILALTDAAGDTARLLNGLHVNDIVPLDDVQTIKRFLPDFLRRLRDNAVRPVDRALVMQYSRRASTGILAGMLDELVADSPRSA